MRGIYPADSFASQQKYGLRVLKSTDESLLNYLKGIHGQMKGMCTISF